MTACPDQTMLLQGLTDGELDAANALAVEAHLKTCQACHDEFRRLQALRETLSYPGVAYRAPQSLRLGLDQALAEAVAPTPSPRRAPPHATPWMAGGAALAACLALALALPQIADNAVDHQLVSSHVRSLLASHLVDIVTSSQHVVRPWFNGKVDIAPPVPELADQGFPLAGGRLDYIEGQVVPAIVYHRRLHTVNVFVQRAKGLALDHASRRDGYSVLQWTDGGLRYSAVSDIDLKELMQFKAAFEGAAKE